MPPAPRISGSTSSAAILLATAEMLERIERTLFMTGRRKRNRVHIEEQWPISGIEDAALARGHGADRVPVIAVLHDHNARPRRTHVVKEAQCHLQRHFD